MSRQTDRQEDRRMAKHEAHMTMLALRRYKARDLRARQTARELDGSYVGRRPVALCITPSRSRINSRKLKKGVPYSRAEVQYGRFV